MADPFGPEPQLALSLAPMCAHYERLGTAQDIVEVRPYAEAAAKGYLAEYGEARRRSLLNRVGEFFGPDRWQLDSPPDMLENRWRSAIDILARLKPNPHAQPLYRRLQSHLTECMTLALRDLREPQRATLEPVLLAAQARLTRLSKGYSDSVQ